MRKSFLIAVIAASGILFQTTYASAQTVTIQTFTDRMAWENAVKAANANATILKEDFSGTSIVQPGLTQSGATINNGVLNGSGLGTNYKNFQPPNPLHELNFNPLITAMGGQWNLDSSAPGLEFDLVFHLGNGTQRFSVFLQNPFDNMTQKYGAYNGFFGIVADSPFQNVIYWSIDSNAPQAFTLDDLSYVQSSQRAIVVGDYKFLINPKLLIKR
jgi:hypothetical protein